MKKLDDWLNTITAVIESMLRWGLVALGTVVLIEQFCMVAEHQPARWMSLMIVLIVVLSACAVKEIKDMRKKR